MPKLPVLTSKKLIKILCSHGFIEHHQTGSHKIFLHPEKDLRVTVPFHVRDLPKGTTAAILNQAKIDRNRL